MSNNTDSKELHERRVFLEFAHAANIPGVHDKAEHRNPPEPDIFYPETINPCYFELGRLADDQHAKLVLEMWRRAPEPMSPDISKIGCPQRDVLLRKLKKSYQTNGLPVHLVLYFDTDSPHLEGPIPPMPFEEEAKYVMEPILRESMGPFAKVWYFERYRKTVLWSYP
jgi:hypothetical protein